MEFLDLGCSRGGSISHCRRRFGARRGIGIDNSPAKVAEARAAGVEAVLADATGLDVHNAVRFVSMMHFLEHLPNLETVEATIRSAAAAARDFLFIQHPSFEGEAYLESLGLRQYWWHWHGHPAHVTVEDYCSMFDRVGLRQYMVRYIDPIADSSHPSILPLAASIDQHDYDPLQHPPKSEVGFRRPVWRAQEIFVALRPLKRDEWALITGPA